MVTIKQVLCFYCGGRHLCQLLGMDGVIKGCKRRQSRNEGHNERLLWRQTMLLIADVCIEAPGKPLEVVSATV